MVDRKKILILDPSPIFSDTLREVIETSESRVEVAIVADTDQAEAVLRRNSVDAVFMDIAIPGVNGIRFIAAIKRLAPDARIIVLSSHDSAEYKEASLRIGADFFLSKERSGGMRLIDVIHQAVQSNADR